MHRHRLVVMAAVFVVLTACAASERAVPGAAVPGPGTPGADTSNPAAGGTAGPSAPSREEEMANRQPQEYCYNQCLYSGGGGGATAADRQFCRQRCTY